MPDLCNRLTEKILRQLAAANRRFSSVPWPHLYARGFGSVGDIPCKNDVIAGINDFLERYVAEVSLMSIYSPDIGAHQHCSHLRKAQEQTPSNWMR